MSEKTVAQKLGIKPGATIWLSHPERSTLLEPFPDDITRADHPGAASLAFIFADSEAALRDTYAGHEAAILNPATTWVIYPKANKADINRDTIWPILGEVGLRPNGQVAIDSTWSALRFRPLKPGEAPFAPG